MNMLYRLAVALDPFAFTAAVLGVQIPALARDMLVEIAACLIFQM